MVPIVYAEVDEEHQTIARYALWAHLRKLAGDGRVSAPDPGDLTAPWSPLVPPRLPGSVAPFAPLVRDGWQEWARQRPNPGP